MRTVPRLLLILVIASPVTLFADPDRFQRTAGSASTVSATWKRFRSQNFVAEGTADARLMQSWLEDLETFRSCLAGLFPQTTFTATVPNRIIVLANARALLDVAPLQDGRPDTKVGGYFLGLPEANYLVVADRKGGLTALYHEYAHFMIDHALGDRVPTWANEGLAEFYSMFTVDRGKRLGTLGSLNPRFYSLTVQNLLPVRKMITAEGAAEFKRDTDAAQRFYAQSWALVHYLTIGHKGKREGQFARYLLLTASGKPSEEAFQEAFQVSPERIQDELLVYLSGVAIPVVTIPMPPPQPVSAKPEPMFEWEGQAIQGRLLTNLGRLEDADKVLTPANAGAPDDASVRYALAALRRRQARLEEALALLEPVVASESAGFAPRFEYARLLTDLGQHAQAVEQYRRAASLNSSEPGLWYGVSVSMAAQGGVDDAEKAMERVQELDPNPDWYRIRSEAAWGLGLDSMVVGDALRYVSAVGFNTENGLYTALHALLAGRRTKDDARVKVLLDGVVAAVKPKSWPSNLLAFLQGQLDAASLIARANGNGQLTEAHAFVGLAAAIAGRDAEAEPHLKWVIEQGTRTFVEYDLVQGEMKRRKKK